jgi:hypothetical protein
MLIVRSKLQQHQGTPLVTHVEQEQPRGREACHDSLAVVKEEAAAVAHVVLCTPHVILHSHTDWGTVSISHLLHCFLLLSGTFADSTPQEKQSQLVRNL